MNDLINIQMKAANLAIELDSEDHMSEDFAMAVHLELSGEDCTWCL